MNATIFKRKKKRDIKYEDQYHYLVELFQTWLEKLNVAISGCIIRKDLILLTNTPGVYFSSECRHSG